MLKDKITVNANDGYYGEITRMGIHQSSGQIQALSFVTEEYIQNLIKELSFYPTFEHKCHNCGGTIELDIRNHIFKCPYCNSVYAIGTQQVNDRVRSEFNYAGPQ